MTVATEKEFKQIASWRHFGLLVAILLVVAVQGLAFHSNETTTSAPVGHSALYLSLILMESALVYLVWRGIRVSNTTLNDLIGGRWRSPRDIVRDFALGFFLWILLLAIANVLRTAGGGGGLSESIVASLPRTTLERILWVVLSIAAGAAEEIVFRGYCQRQLEALTQNRWIALVGQALLFGVSHGYQGVDAMLRITVLGIAFGLMALWRRSLRPGIIAHAWTDAASGLFYPR